MDMVEREGIRLLGEALDQEDPLKEAIYPYADRAIVNLLPQGAQNDHVRMHLVQPTVMAVAAANCFRSTKERPVGAALLRRIADLLEKQQLDQIPWGPSNPHHKPIIRALIEKTGRPAINYNDGDEGMMSFMELLEGEFHESIDKLVQRFEFATEGALENVITGLLTIYMLRRLAVVEDPDSAWATVREEAKDQGWIRLDTP